MKKIFNVVVLGSTGSMGTQTLAVLEKYSKYFKVIGLSANKNEKLLKLQAKKFKVPQKNLVLSSLKNPTRGGKNLIALAKLKNADIIINNISGVAGIYPTISAIKNNKIVLLANKESLVAEGKKIMSLLSRSSRASIIPLDSEHNSIFEILQKFPSQKIKKIIIPCSGGPFFAKTKKELKNLTVKNALNHPKWKMGKKISIESTTLLNKGFEILEAHYLFNIPLNKIKSFIHPECQIHAIIQFENGKIFAYVSKPDMKLHIENALRHVLNLPKKQNQILKLKNFPNKKNLNILGYKLFQIDHKTFPGIKIVLNAHKKSHKKMYRFLQREEKIIQKFLDGKVTFADLFSV